MKITWIILYLWAFLTQITCRCDRAVILKCEGLSQPLISIHSVMLISFGGFFAEYFVDESTNCSIFKTLENSEQSPLVTSIVINSWQINFPVSWRNNRSSFSFILIIFTQKKIIFRCKMSESAEIIHNFLAKAKKMSLDRVWSLKWFCGDSA